MRCSAGGESGSGKHIRIFRPIFGSAGQGKSGGFCGVAHYRGGLPAVAGPFAGVSIHYGLGVAFGGGHIDVLGEFIVACSGGNKAVVLFRKTAAAIVVGGGFALLGIAGLHNTAVREAGVECHLDICRGGKYKTLKIRRHGSLGADGTHYQQQSQYGHKTEYSFHRCIFLRQSDLLWLQMILN